MEVGGDASRWGPKPVTGITNISQPTMMVYPPKNTNSGAAVVVFPGGGYLKLAIDLEGTEACDWLTASGITCILLKYRVPGSGPHWDEKLKTHIVPKVFTALQDAQRTVGLVRSQASKWKIDPNKVGVLGFSAGGHLVAEISTNYKKRLYPEIDAADKASCRPDFAIALYPGHMSIDHDKDLSKLNPQIHVSAETPPTFLVHAQNDPIDPVEYSLLYYAALREAKVPTELHLYAEGGHAFALRRNNLPITRWTDLADTWLTTIGVLPKK
jgi:acetyl esterase/lipase